MAVIPLHPGIIHRGDFLFLNKNIHLTYNVVCVKIGNENGGFGHKNIKFAFFADLWYNVYIWSKKER